MYLLFVCVIVGALVWFFGLEKSWMFICLAYKYIKNKLFIDNSTITVADNRNYFMINGNFGDETLKTIYVQSLKGMFKYTIKATKMSPDEIQKINLIKKADCYLGTDISCEILGVSKIVVWVYKANVLVGSEEITESKTIRESVLHIIENEESKRRSMECSILAKTISPDKIEAEAVEQD